MSVDPESYAAAAAFVATLPDEIRKDHLIDWLGDLDDKDLCAYLAAMQTAIRRKKRRGGK